MKVLLVQGTWGGDDPWWVPRVGDFAKAVEAAGHEVINGRPFNWEGGLGGIVPFTSADLLIWKGAGRYLREYLDPRRALSPYVPEETAIIAHSHGRQVVKYACHLGLRVQKVILVSGPVRHDVDERTFGARANMGSLVCINGGKRDRMQIFGGLFDGHWGIHRQDPEATIYEQFPDADHGSFLTDPRHFDYVLRYL